MEDGLALPDVGTHLAGGLQQVCAHGVYQGCPAQNATREDGAKWVADAVQIRSDRRDDDRNLKLAPDPQGGKSIWIDDVRQNDIWLELLYMRQQAASRLPSVQWPREN